MKIKIVIGLIFCIFMTGCESRYQDMSENKGYTKYFKIIADEGKGYIVYDTRTGVEYWCSDTSYNIGSLTLLVDKNGKPLIHEAAESEDMDD